VVHGFFQNLFDKTISHLESLLKNPIMKNAKLMFLVGGFSESLLLQQTMIQHFESQGVEVKVPARPGFAVISGAVQFGFQPTSIVSRVAHRTYGIETSQIWSDSAYLGGKKLTVGSASYCENAFDTFVTKGDWVELKTQVTRIYTPVDPYQSIVDLPVYSSDKENVFLTSDPSVEYVGCLTLEIPDK
jgi:hypothetical protein